MAVAFDVGEGVEVEDHRAQRFDVLRRDSAGAAVPPESTGTPSLSAVSACTHKGGPDHTPASLPHLGDWPAPSCVGPRDNGQL